MNFEDTGELIAILENTDEKDKKLWKRLHLTGDKNVAGNSFREIKLKDKPNLHFQVVPNKKTERTIRYVTGASGSGKSYWTKMYADEYHRIYPKREIYILSSIKEDKTLDKIKDLHRVKLDSQEFLTEDITAQDFKDCLVIFDDTDCLTDKRQKLKVDAILNSVLETGRHFNVEVVYTSHLACNGKDTRRILNECKSVTIFPSGLGGKSIKYLLDNYFGLDKEQIKKIKKLNSRWVTIQKGFPMSVLSDKECFILNSPDDE
jgi:hypothetical protein